MPAAKDIYVDLNAIDDAQLNCCAVLLRFTTFGVLLTNKQHLTVTDTLQNVGTVNDLTEILMRTTYLWDLLSLFHPFRLFPLCCPIYMLYVITYIQIYYTD